MDRNTKGVIVLTAAAVVLSYIDYRKVKKEESLKRAEIIAETAAEINALEGAAYYISQKIRNGEYRPTGIDQLVNDLKFETMMHREFDK